VARAPSQQWLHFEDKTFTLEQAQLEVAGAADVLAGYGVTRGASVLATARNSPAYLFAWLAVTQLGAAIAAVNPESTGAELRGLLGQVRPAVVISDMGLRERVQEAIAEVAPGTPHVLAEELSAASSPPLPASPARPDDVAVMIPTSGTTGRPKLVMQTHRAYTMAGQGFPFWLGLTERDRLMTSLPLFHVNAPAYSVLGSLVGGAGLVLLPRFSAKAFIDQARRYGATEFNAIGAMLEILMRQPERAADADNPLRLCYTGPSPPKDRQLAIERRFGFEIVCGYALSESPYGLVWRRGTRPYGTLGSARQHPELGEVNKARVIGDNGDELNPGEVGELQLRNPAIMAGYLDMPQETAEVMVDGWLRTGDLVKVNSDGTYTFVSRKKEVIRRRGENLSPVEVELALEEHPAVAEAAVVGVPSELSEEEVKAFVVLVGEERVPLVDLRAFLAARLAPFKVPRFFEVVDRLPHTATGRVAKQRLPRERTAAEEDLGDLRSRSIVESR
jgi:crotonobetaine/carnitine-CoA ligase